MLRTVALALILIPMGGCSDELVLNVDVRTDYAPGAEFARVRTDVVRGPSMAGGLETSQSAQLPVMAGQDFLDGWRVAEFELAESGTYLVRATLLDSAGAEVASRDVRVTLNATFGLTILITRSCGGVVCPRPDGDPAATTCLGGRCVPPECSPSEPAACGTEECADDSGCDARVSCAEGRCVDGYCLQTPVEGACAPGEWCSVERGCLPLEGADAGPGSCVPEAEACNGADDDCDGTVDEDFDLTIDPDNCGACGVVCAASHATASCSAGSCELGCDAGWADCDRVPGTGCEADLSSAGSCGVCGTVCVDPEPLCVAGSGGASCASSCPPDSPVLCGASCVDTDTSLAHCGGCGVVCEPASGTGACGGGSCSIAACDPGWADCNSDASDGCESDLSDPSSCGACGTSCGAARPFCVPSAGSYGCSDGCGDGVRGGGETDVDCGGPLCSACSEGSMCTGDPDCAGTLRCLGGRCAPCGECAAGAMESTTCGMCGMQTRTCQASCSWGSWSACSGEGVCAPGAMDSESCGNCGSRSRVCNSSCGWGAWGACSGTGPCAPGASEMQSCGNCGTQTRSCGGTCTWGGWGSCGGEGVCSPGSTTGSGCYNSCQRRTCNSGCSYPAAPDGCVACGCTVFTQCGLTCPSNNHATSYSRSFSCGSGTTNNQARCEPDCGSSFSKCGLTCPGGYHATGYSRSFSCGSGTTNNQARCELNGSPCFVQCGLTCPSGYHSTSFSRSFSCGSGTTNNQARCCPD